MRALNEMRRKKPSSGQEVGFNQRESAPEERTNQANQENFQQGTGNVQRGYGRGLGRERRGARNERVASNRFYGDRQRQDGQSTVGRAGSSAKSDFEKRDALSARRNSLRNGSAASKITSGSGKYAMAKSKINVAKRKVGAASDITKDAMVLAKSAVNPVSFFSLLGQIDLLKDIPYVAALIASGFDDFLVDWSGLTDVAPGTGSVISTCLEIFMGLMFTMASVAEGGDMDRIKRQMLRRLGLLLASTTVEIVPVLDILPTEFGVALLIYAFLLAERKRKSDHKKKERKAEVEEEKAERKERVVQKEPEMAKAA